MEISMELKLEEMDLGDRVKHFEMLQTTMVLDENQPICVRIDGKNFSTYTKHLKKPYDERLSKIMISTMNHLVEKSQAKLGYTQSDEISLVFFKTDENQEMFYAGKIQKLASILASMATAKFAQEISKVTGIPEKADDLALFDCRIWNVPTLYDAAEVFAWRQDDAIKNSISMAAYANFPHNSLQEKNSRTKIEMLAAKGIVWDDYPEFFKSGTYAKRTLVNVPMTDEMRKFPSNKDKDSFVRTDIVNFHHERLSRLKTPIDEILFKHVFDTASLKKQYKVSMK
jgi:tRNA(His) guanylyltransferase